MWDGPVGQGIIGIIVALLLFWLGNIMNLPTWIKQIYSFLIFIILSGWVGWIFLTHGKQWSIHKRVILAFFVYGSIGLLLIESLNHLDIERLIFVQEKPNVKVDIELISYYEDKNLKIYSLIIQNSNSKSAIVTDCRIEFVFKNIIVQVDKQLLLDTGKNISIGGVAIFKDSPNGPEYMLKEQTANTSISNKLSLKIKQVKAKKKINNTNILLFHCDRWPRGAALGGTITVDLSKTSIISKISDRGESQYYEGIYWYEIKGQRFSQTINGPITNN